VSRFNIAERVKVKADGPDEHRNKEGVVCNIMGSIVQIWQPGTDPKKWLSFNGKQLEKIMVEGAQWMIKIQQVNGTIQWLIGRP